MTRCTAALAKKMEKFLAKLIAGKTVQNRDLATWLGDDWIAGFEQAWIEQKERRQEFSEKPDAVLEYETRFKKARLLENRANAYSLRGNSKQAQIFHAKAEVAFERLLERHGELTSADYSLHSWFDRIPEFTAGNEPSLCAEAMPHVRTSRSLSNTASGHSAVEKKRALKIRLLEETLAGFTYVEQRSESELQVKSASEAALLSKFLKSADGDQD
jgi:hypothetical protein